MPAYFDTGFSVREPMWHGQGLVLDDYPVDWTDARKKAGLEWEPIPQPMYQLNPAIAVCCLCGRMLNELHTDECAVHATQDEFGPMLVRPQDVDAQGLTNSIVEVVDHKLIVRSDTYAPLGPVGAGYELVTHAEQGEILEGILGLGVKFETAGSCKGGAQTWALAYLDEPYTVAGDDTETYPFIALLNSHDGSGACKITLTQIRVVCWNTYQAASMQGERHGRQYIFRHTSGVHDRLEEAKKALAGAREEASEWQELAAELFGIKADDAVFERYLHAFIPEPPEGSFSPRVRSNIDSARSKFKEIYLDGVTCEAHRGTALGLLDASVEYLDHVRGYRNHDKYLGRTLFKPNAMKTRALSMIREHCS